MAAAAFSFAAAAFLPASACTFASSSGRTNASCTVVVPSLMALHVARSSKSFSLSISPAVFTPRYRQISSSSVTPSLREVRQTVPARHLDVYRLPERNLPDLAEAPLRKAFGITVNTALRKAMDTAAFPVTTCMSSLYFLPDFVVMRRFTSLPRRIRPKVVAHGLSRYHPPVVPYYPHLHVQVTPRPRYYLGHAHRQPLNHAVVAVGVFPPRHVEAVLRRLPVYRGVSQYLVESRREVSVAMIWMSASARSIACNIFVCLIITFVSISFRVNGY